MEENQPKQFLPGYSSVEAYTKDGFKTLVEATKASNGLPVDRDWNYYNVYESFTKIMNAESDRVLRLMNNILHIERLEMNIRNRDVEEKMEMVIEANDEILEKVALRIDEMNGIRQSTKDDVEMQAVSAQLPVNGSWNQLNKATYSVTSSIDKLKRDTSLKSVRLLTAKNIIRPQSFFKDKIDNRNTPWVPRITDKPNSLKPLALFLEQSERGEEYSHPYEIELERFAPYADQLKEATPVFPKPLEQTPLLEVSTPEQLNELLEELRKHSEFAVDLEHHSYRTFMGITCLMQISTPDADYIIDTLALRDKLYILNEVFTKRSIVKVFHGADSDVEWLQRDLSLYVVNMFDTYKASKQLGYSGLSLAYLLHRFCNVIPNKHFQLADWRIRPLPEELKTYARMDTHYLLYIYQRLKNELLKKANGADNILKSVIQDSTEVCKRRYFKPILKEESHLDFYRKCKRMFDNRQMFALKKLYQWRDNIARLEDESTGYVLPNHMLLQVSETLPREMQGILACCNPIPPLVRANLLELHRIILQAREQSLVKPIMKEETRSRGSTLKFTKINIDSPLHCPHDLSRLPEFRDDLPTLFDLLEKTVKSEEKKGSSRIEKKKSMYSVFNTPESSDNEDESNNTERLSFLAPYERYKLVKPFIQAEEEKDASEKPLDKSVEDENQDRIAALHAHFVKAVAGTSQKTEKGTPHSQRTFPPKSLVEMGGSKKRKRLDSQPEDEPEGRVPQNEFHTPVPNQSEEYWNQEFSKKAMRNRLRQRRRRNKKMQEKYQNTENGQEILQNNAQGIPGNSRQNKRQKQNRNEQSEENKHKVGKGKRYFQKTKMKEQLGQQKKPEQQKNQKQKNPKYQNFKPFDYSQVNYQEFQGGAGSPNKKREFKQSFKAKNKNKNKMGKKQNNKSITYARGTQ